MKRFVFFLTIIIGTVLLTSCSNKENHTDERGRQAVVLARSAQKDFTDEAADRLIASYNSKSADYFIEERLYESGNNLMIDVLAGKSPDILMFGDWIDASSLYGKERLADIYAFIDSDGDISRSDFVEPVLKTLETDGRLYCMPYDFSVDSAVVKTELWGDDSNTNFEHIAEISEKKGCVIPFDFTVNSYNFMNYISSEYIDFSKGKCSFDDGRFEAFLEFLNRYAVRVDNTDRDTLYNMFINDEMLMLNCGFAGFDQIDYLESDAGGKIKFIGLPSGTGNIVIPETAFGIFEQSDSKLGAFDFIKSCTSYKAYVSEAADGEFTGVYCLPINKMALDFCYDHSLKRNSYRLSEEKKKRNNDEILRQINSVRSAYFPSGNAVQTIISEETATYFNGEKSASEVCSIIQNRVSTYLEENYG